MKIIQSSLVFLFVILNIFISENQSYVIRKRNNIINGRKVRYTGLVLPSNTTKVGAIGGLAVNDDDDLIVFHRGSRVWSWDTFFGDNFNAAKYGPIGENVLELIDAYDLEKLYSWGSHKFLMPHGLTLDMDGNIWLTDVGYHQVFKYNFRSNSTDPLKLTLGEKLVKGSDSKHFCKPTKVAISSLSRDIFVADGYCNSRVVRFDRDGKYLQEYVDSERPLIIAHSIALIEPLDLVCTVSREEGRIVCFDVSRGQKKFDLTHSQMRTVYSIVYDNLNKVIHAAAGSNQCQKSIGLTFDARNSTFGKLFQTWDAGNDDLSQTHDIGISFDGSLIYLGQLNGKVSSFEYS